MAGLTVGGTTSLALVGDDEARPSLPTCAGNKINGPATIKGNFGGVEFDGNTVTGPLTSLALTAPFEFSTSRDPVIPVAWTRPKLALT